jgi:hypothetical protein
MDWLDAARARGWLRVLATMTLVVAGLWLLLSHDGLDVSGRPIGTDFISFWSAARLLTNGAAPGAPYDRQLLGAIQTATFHGADVGFTPFPYPPIFLLACLPLGALPYTAALGVWLATTGAAYVLTLRRWLGAQPGSLLLLVAYPGVLVNAANGQNGFLTTGLFGAGAWMLRRRPLAAGACLGALIFKPHLGLLIPLALITTRAWRAIVAANAAAVALVALSLLILGLQPWRGFLDNAPLMSAVLTTSLLDPGKLQSAFAAAKLLGAGNAAAFAIQGLFAAFAALSLILLGRRTGADEGFGASLVSATLITTPYLLSYDLMLAAVPMAWLFSQARRTGFLPWEKLVLLAAFVLPPLSLALGVGAKIPVAPLVLTALHLATLRRAWGEREADATRRRPARAKPVGAPA